MSKIVKRGLTVTAILAYGTLVSADSSVQLERHELMEGVRDATKPLGDMLRGKQSYDAELVADSLATWRDAAAKFGDLFPTGSETGADTRAKPAIWEDRAGFNKALANWQTATDAAIAAAPATLEAAKPVLGPALEACKACHDKYRAEKY
jgi:cytochrome c556